MATAKKKSRANQRAPSEVDKEIGRRLRLLRVERQMSQMELGAVLGITFQQVQKYEKGTNRIGAGRLVEIATKLNTTLHELVGWQDKKTITPLMDVDTYKLMQVFSRLPDRFKTPIRSLIASIIATE